MSLYDRLNEEISLYDLFDISDPRITYLTKDKPCQISCPFHGIDTHPSARVYPKTNSFRCFYCSKSWNVVTFWAESNKYLKSDGSLDISRSIDDLATRHNISVDTFDWQRKFYNLKKRSESHQEVQTASKLTLLDYYSWQISSKLSKLEQADRLAKKIDILHMWSDLDNIDLSTDSWDDDLKKWYKSAKIIVHA